MINSAPKGASNLYGNPSEKPTENINYPYAKKFNKQTLMSHYTNHGYEVGATDIWDYEAMAVDFANDVNNVTHDSFVDDRGTTYKFSYETYEFAIITKNGMIVTYFVPDKGEVYWHNVKEKYNR